MAYKVFLVEDEIVAREGMRDNVNWRSVAHQGSELQLRAWQALGMLAEFCGVGHKTTMGMGAVSRIS